MPPIATSTATMIIAFVVWGIRRPGCGLRYWFVCGLIVMRNSYYRAQWLNRRRLFPLFHVADNHAGTGPQLLLFRRSLDSKLIRFSRGTMRSTPTSSPQSSRSNELDEERRSYLL